MLSAIAAENDLEMCHVDICQGFRTAPLENPIAIHMPTPRTTWLGCAKSRQKSWPWPAGGPRGVDALSFALEYAYIAEVPG